MNNLLRKGQLKDFVEFNRKYDNGEYRGSEARKYDLVAIKTFLSIRSKLTYTDNYSVGEWRTLRIVTHCSKYGTNYIFIDIKRKLWRTQETPNEFYGYLPTAFDENEQ